MLHVMDSSNLLNAVITVVLLLVGSFVVGVGGVWLIRAVVPPNRPPCGRLSPKAAVFREVLQYPRVGAPFAGLAVGAIVAAFVGPSSNQGAFAALTIALVLCAGVIASHRSLSVFEVRYLSTMLGRSILILLFTSGLAAAIAGAAGLSFTLSMFISISALGAVVAAALAFQLLAASPVITDVAGVSREYRWNESASRFVVHYDIGKRRGTTKPLTPVTASHRKDREVEAAECLLADALGREEVPTAVSKSFAVAVVAKKNFADDWSIHLTQVEYWLRSYLTMLDTEDIGPWPPDVNDWHKRGVRPLLS